MGYIVFKSCVDELYSLFKHGTDLRIRIRSLCATQTSINREHLGNHEILDDLDFLKVFLDDFMVSIL